jgi:hypothetical protein
VHWWRRRIVAADGTPRRFTGGPLSRVSFELDALYYGVPQHNEVQAGLRFVEALDGILAGLTGRQPERIVPAALDLDTTAWIGYLGAVMEPESLPANQDPSTAVNFKLDVLRALADLPSSQFAAFVHLMDGFEPHELARLLPRKEGRGPWSEESVERAVRRASSRIRSLCAVDAPGKRKRQPRPVAKGIEVIHQVEAEVDQIRSRRAA